LPQDLSCGNNEPHPYYGFDRSVLSAVKTARRGSDANLIPQVKTWG